MCMFNRVLHTDFDTVFVVSLGWVSLRKSKIGFLIRKNPKADFEFLY